MPFESRSWPTNVQLQLTMCIDIATFADADIEDATTVIIQFSDTFSTTQNAHAHTNAHTSMCAHTHMQLTKPLHGLVKIMRKAMCLVLFHFATNLLFNCCWAHV